MDRGQSQSQSNEEDGGFPLPPMPMDSKEVLQEFATGPLLCEMEVVDNDPNTNGNGTVKPASIHKLDQGETASEGWYKRLCRWVPTSPQLLEQAEKKILSYVKTIYEGKFIEINPTPKNPNASSTEADGSSGSGNGKRHCRWSSLWGSSKEEQVKMWTLIFNKEAEKTATPLVFVHGLCASAGLWALNVDELAKNRPVYALDLLGFGKSSRPKFSLLPEEAEMQHVEALEAWRKEVGLEKFIIVGHSMGGFLSASYAMKYPERVAHLVLADPWGFPEKPDQVEKALPVNRSVVLKTVTTIGQYINPLAIVRAAGPMGPGMIGKVRPDLVSKFEALNENGGNVAEYIYHCNAQDPTGEAAFRTMMDFFGWAKRPMCNRMQDLHAEIPLTMIYGGRTWLQQLPEQEIKNLRPDNSHTEVYVVPGAGHHPGN